MAATLEDFAVIYFGNDWYAENRTSSHHIAERLARRTRVLYVDTPGLRAPKATERDVRRLLRKLAAAAAAPRRIGNQMWHATMPQIPFRRSRLAREVNLAVGRWLVARAAKQLGLSRTLSWFAVPHAGPLAGQLGESFVVYYCIDDFAALPDVDPTSVANLDAQLTRRADQVFVASARLLPAKRDLNATAMHAPHGVDVDLFQRALDSCLPVAEGAMNLRHPVVGFYGLIEAWIDLDLVAYLAERRPHWTFLMIGRLAVDPGRLRQLRNVRFVGPQPYLTLPNWAKAFDVAIVPYRPTRQVLNSSSLKVREYLAAGRPVVAMANPDIDRSQHCVRIATDPDTFLRHLDDALAHDSIVEQTRRLEAVKDMSWDSRVEQVASVVEEQLRKKLCVAAA